MNRFRRSFLLVLAAVAMIGPASGDSPEPEVELVTTLGSIVIRLFPQQAPGTSAWVLELVDQGSFDGTSFYRAGILGAQTQPSLVEGGMLDDFVMKGTAKTIQETGLPVLQQFETTTQSGLKHQYGVVSLARDLLVTGDAIPDLVICIADLPELDEAGRTVPDTRGFPAFGQVISGMDIVEKIASGERNGPASFAALQGQILTEPVVIRYARRL